MKKIEAKIIADSISPQGHRITSMLLTYPRFIHAELMTHRMFSRNSASSRAIPFEKMVKMVEEDPFIPIAWQKSHVGMQGNDYIQTDDGLYVVNKYWLEARDKAVKAAKDLYSCNITKQLCNRLLEPFMWHTVLVTATEWGNFFELRCPKLYHAATGLTYNSLKDWNNVDKEIQYNGLTCLHPENSSQAEIHMQALAENMWDAMNESSPKELKEGEYHIPFGDKITDEGIWSFISHEDEIEAIQCKIAVARCARLSYMTFDGKIDYEKDIKLHDQLLKDKHFSPFEHVTRCMSDEEYTSLIKGKFDIDYADRVCDDYQTISGGSSLESFGWCNNFRGFIPYRYLIENETSN